MKTCRLVLLSFCAAAFVMAPALACRIPDIRPWPRPPRPHPIPPRPAPRLEPMRTRIHTADVRIHNAVASVKVTAVFFNPNSTRVEGTYFFPVEPDAVVRDFTMTANGKEMKAELLDADKARRTYEDIVRRMKDPALLEYVGTRMLKARVFPIEPNSEVKVTLRYSEVAKADGGVYHFRYPLRSARPNAGSIDQVAVEAGVTAGSPVKLFYSPSHKIDTVRKSDKEVNGGFELEKNIPERDFDLYWSLDKADIGVSVATYRPKGEDGYCMLALTPKVERKKKDVQPKDIVFVFDKSGSMDGEKIDQAKKALKFCLRHLNNEDRFAVIAFSTDADLLTDGLAKATPQAIDKALEKVQEMDARGGTAIHEAVTTAFGRLEKSDRPSMVVFLTDGRPTIGNTDIGEILKAAKKKNAAGARLFVFGVGYDLNTDLLDRLAVENGGTQQYVGEKEDIEVKVSRFYEQISEPVLSGAAVEVKGIDLRDLYPRNLPDIFAGSQVLLFGRYRGDGRQTVVLRGKADGKERAFECEADFDGVERNDFLPAVWAHRKVAFLMEEIRLHGHNKELEDEIVALGKQYGIVTPYTSFLIVDDDAPLARERLHAARRSFEGRKGGRDGVLFSRGVATAKAMEAPAPAGAPMILGFGNGGGLSDGAWEAEPVRRMAQARMLKLADKVFYRKEDGFYYDSAFEESMRDRIVEVKYFSDEYFELLTRHEGIGRYLSEKAKIVVCVDGKVYRITE